MALSEGSTFAGYTVIRLLGAGGMGEVYLVQHPRLPRRDALKILSERASGEADRERFLREADLAAGLWHPNIVRVNDRGEFDGQLWIAMDYIDGADAGHLLRKYPAGAPTLEVADIVTAVADALDYAHRHGLLHRDVKPANIMLANADDDDRRRVLLGDFGIARNADEISGLTATNTTVGTVAYAAPEQLMGEQIDGRADQYALAATAYHLLTGAVLFPNSNPAAVISRHLNASPPLLSSLRPDLAALDPVLARALSKGPADRYQRCADFARDFAACTADLAQPAQWAPTLQAPVPLKTPAIQTLPPSHTDRQPHRWIVPAAIAAVFAVITGIVVAFALRPHAEPGSSTTTTVTATPNLSPRSSASFTTPQASPVPPPRRAGPTAAPVAVPVGYSGAFVITRSGKTACQLTASDVGCQVDWAVRTPEVYGGPTNGVRVYANGSWEWANGDMGNQNFTVLNYGTVYRALGWTITPTSDGTTFKNDATGHGMTVSVQGVDPF